MRRGKVTDAEDCDTKHNWTYQWKYLISATGLKKLVWSSCVQRLPGELAGSWSDWIAYTLLHTGLIATADDDRIILNESYMWKCGNTCRSFGYWSSFLHQGAQIQQVRSQAGRWRRTVSIRFRAKSHWMSSVRAEAAAIEFYMLARTTSVCSEEVILSGSLRCLS